MRKSKMKTYNDGVFFVYLEVPQTTDFAAKKNARDLSDLVFVGKLTFSEVSRRDQDMLFAEAMGRHLTLKLKTPFMPLVKSYHKVVFDNYMYDIIKLDRDRQNQELYFYLEGVRPIAE